MDITSATQAAQNDAVEARSHKIGSWTALASLVAYLPFTIDNAMDALLMGLVFFIAFYTLPKMIVASFMTRNFSGTQLNIGALSFFVLLVFFAPGEPGELSRLMVVVAYALAGFCVGKLMSLFMQPKGSKS